MPRIVADTELILNADGSVYHLNLLPDEIAQTIILVGDQDRVPEVSKHFDKIEIAKNKREFVTHTGFIGSKRLSVISTGIGTDNIDIVLNELDILINIDLKTREVKSHETALSLFRIGTSGALQENIPVDSVLVSTHAVGLDGLLNYYKAERNESVENEISKQLAYDFIKPYFAEASNELIKKFDNRFLKGITATCSGFYAPQGRQIRKEIITDELIIKLRSIKIKDKQITNFEMETAAIYGLSNVFGFNAVSVNAILANRITNQFSIQPKQTIEKAILQTLEVICS